MGTPETSTMLVLVSASCLRDWNFETLISDLSRCDVQISKSYNINTLSLFMESVRAWQSRECQQALANFNLKDDERVTELNFVVSRADHADTTEENRTAKEEDGRQPVEIESFPSGSFVIETNKGGSYLLRRYPELKNWATWSPARVRSAMMDIDTLRESPIFQRISTYVANVASFNAKEKGKGSDSGRHWWPPDDLTIMRVVTSTILFFLVQLLIRLYQYSLRLASFWESRADAVLLNDSFAETKSERFEDLVSALAPDGYDFKAMPKSPLDWLWRSRSRIPNIQP